jgi:hypothetical protein
LLLAPPDVTITFYLWNLLMTQLSRRDFLTLVATTACCAAGVADEAKSCLPILTGALQQFSPPTGPEWLAGWRRELEEQQKLGFDLFWLANTSVALQADTSPDPLLALLDMAHEKGMSAILDIGGTPSWYITMDVATECAAAAKNVNAIRGRYGSHPAFYGWYVPQEIYVSWGPFGAFIDALYPALVSLCKEALPGKPVSISPFFILDQDKVFGDFRYADPTEYEAYWTQLIQRSGFDIIMLQDSGEHFSYVTNAQRAPFFEAMRRACAAGGARLWGNVETAEFECPSVEAYVQRYGRIHHTAVPDAPWRAVPVPRVKEKLELAAQYCERLVTWGYAEKCRPALGPEGEAWYQEYLLYRRSFGEISS